MEGRGHRPSSSGCASGCYYLHTHDMRYIRHILNTITTHFRNTIITNSKNIGCFIANARCIGPLGRTLLSPGHCSAMGRKGASRNRGAGGAAAGQSQSGKKWGPSTLRNFAIAGLSLAVVCGLFFLLPGGPNTNQRSPRADESAIAVAAARDDAGRVRNMIADRRRGSRRIAVRTST